MNIIYLLFSFKKENFKSESIKFLTDYCKIINIIKKEKKDCFIELYQIKFNKEDIMFIPFNRDNSEFSYILKYKISKGHNFIYNNNLKLEKNKNLDNVNHLSFEDEFSLYYELISSFELYNKNEILYTLINSSLDLLFKTEEKISFAFFMKVFLKCSSENIAQRLSYSELTFKIKGDITNIKNEEVYGKINYLSQAYVLNKRFQSNINHIRIIYIIFKDIPKLKELISIEDKKNTIFFCLENFKNLFCNSLKMYPDYSFLFNEIEEFKKIKYLLNCSCNLSDIIYLLNKKKEIIKYLKEKEKNINDIILLNEYINPKNREELNSIIQESFYISICQLKEYEKKTNTKIIDFKINFGQNILLYTKQQLRKILILYFSGNDYSNELSNLKLKVKDIEKLNFNNFEIFGLIDIFFISNKSYISDSNSIFAFIQLLNFENISKQFKEYILTINWNLLIKKSKKLENFYDAIFKLFYKNIQMFKFLVILIKILLKEYIYEENKDILFSILIRFQSKYMDLIKDIKKDRDFLSISKQYISILKKVNDSPIETKDLRVLFFPEIKNSNIKSKNILKIKKNIFLIFFKNIIYEIYHKNIIILEKICKKQLLIKENQFTIKNIIDFLLLIGFNEKKIVYEEKIFMKNLQINKIVRIISKLNDNQEATEFLLTITSQDCRNIQELAGEVHGGNNQNFLSIDDLLSLEKLVETFERIKNCEKININNHKDKDIQINDEDNNRKLVQDNEEKDEIYCKKMKKKNYLKIRN